MPPKKEGKKPQNSKAAASGTPEIVKFKSISFSSYNIFTQWENISTFDQCAVGRRQIMMGWRQKLASSVNTGSLSGNKGSVTLISSPDTTHTHH